MISPIAYSYLRFSDPSQALGDSRRRQASAAAKYAADHGLTLDDTLRDEGISAFRGRHRGVGQKARTGRPGKEGALGAFLAKVKSGEVKRGSYLLLDSFDRLTREKENAALHLFTGIVAAGVNVVTLNNGKVYTEKTTTGLTDLLNALMELSRSHTESAEKSRKVRAALRSRRARAQKAGRPWAQRWPFWLDQTPDGFIVLEDRADLLREIFAAKVDGLGNAAICARLNARGETPPRQPGWRPTDIRGVLAKAPGCAAVAPDIVARIRELTEDGLDAPGVAKVLNDDQVPPVRKPVWHTATVANLLSSRSVFGEFQPHVLAEDSRERVPDGEPLVGYYPEVVTRAQFEAARAVIESRASSSASAKGLEFRNLLVGLVRCGKCGGTAGYWQGGNSSKPHLQPHKVIRCNAVNGGGCDNKTRVNYPRMEAELLAYVGGLPIAERNTAVVEQLAAKRAELADVEAKRKRLVNMVEDDDEPDPDIMERIRERRGEARALTASIKALEKTARAEQATPTPGDWRVIMGRLIHDLGTADEPTLYAIRAQINQRLAQAVTGGFLLADGHITARFSTSDPKGGQRKPLYYGAEGGLIRWEMTAGAPEFDQVQIAPGGLVVTEGT